MRWNVRDRVTGQVRQFDNPGRKAQGGFIQMLRLTTTVGQKWGRA